MFGILCAFSCTGNELTLINVKNQLYYTSLIKTNKNYRHSFIIYDLGFIKQASLNVSILFYGIP